MNTTCLKNKNSLGYNIIGFISGKTETSNAARNTIRILTENWIPFSVIDIDVNALTTENIATLTNPATYTAPYSVNMFYLNPEEFEALADINPPWIDFETKINAIVPFEGVTSALESWFPFPNKINLILAPSHRIEQIIAANADGIPVRYFPQTSIIQQGISSQRSRFNLPENTVLFFADFEMLNDMSLKKAWTVLNAFDDTFSINDDVALVIKINDEKSKPSFAEEIKKIRSFSLLNCRIILRDEIYSHTDTLSLLASSDIVVSINYPDCIGFNAMEAMLLGKPVIAMNWGGNMDFMNDQNACLIPYTLSHVLTDTSDKQKKILPTVSAEPDNKALGMCMRRLHSDNELRYRMGSRAQADMLNRQIECRKCPTLKMVCDIQENMNFYKNSTDQSEKISDKIVQDLLQKSPEHFNSIMKLLVKAEHTSLTVSFETFLNKILYFVENQLPMEAISYYDQFRKYFIFQDVTLDKADFLIKKMKVQYKKPLHAIHVLMPFTREENKEWYTKHFKKFPVVWHTLEKNMKVSVEHPAYKKANSFINTQVIDDDDYFCFLCDDDAYETGIFDNLPDADVIFVSMKRGDVVCGSSISRHPTNTLVAKPENIKLCQVGFEQYIVKGKVFKKMRFNTTFYCSDGEMAIWLKNNFDCIYEPQRYVLFNYLEPGRYLCSNQGSKQN
jgi:glycosyltransferase involved in cell wall biosynthesis